MKHFYRPHRSWGKVIFSQACVILFTGGTCVAGGVRGRGCVARGPAWPGACMAGGWCMAGRRVWLAGGGVWLGGCAWPRGACMASGKGGMHGQEGAWPVGHA